MSEEVGCICWLRAPAVVNYLLSLLSFSNPLSRLDNLGISLVAGHINYFHGRVNHTFIWGSLGFLRAVCYRVYSKNYHLGGRIYDHKVSIQSTTKFSIYAVYLYNHQGCQSIMKHSPWAETTDLKGIPNRDEQTSTINQCTEVLDLNDTYSDHPHH